MIVLLIACVQPPETLETEDEPEPVAERQVPPPTFVDEVPSRLVALGDVHGDIRAARSALRLAGVLEGGHWVGGDAWVVQTGDQLDRGGDEEAILELFERLADEAHEAGGAFLSLLGNHELLNVELDFSYVTDEGFADFADTPTDGLDLDDFPAEQRGRAAAFWPGVGEWALTLSEHNVAIRVGDTVFAHGGVTPGAAAYGLGRLNRDTREWMRGLTAYPSEADDVVWTRMYSDDETEPDCAALQEALDVLGAARMVVGHTVWDAINPACDGRVWRVDVGLAGFYGGPTMVLELRGDEATVLQ
ncbi:MAG: metallophosphoesterase [Myxococcales bacterium]|nr:metallophosphoesterase [Myxococcales bacterium]